MCHDSLVLELGIIWRYTAIIVNAIATFQVAIVKNSGRNNDIKHTIYELTSFTAPCPGTVKWPVIR